MTLPTIESRGTIKYVHARMPGRELVHLVPAEGLTRDTRFGHNEMLVGEARALCGRLSSRWVADGRGEPCPRCKAKR